MAGSVQAVISVELDAPTVARTRLAASPLAEAVTLLGQAAFGRPDPLFGAPPAPARAALADPDVALVALTLQPGGLGYEPDCLTPRPSRDTDVLDGQLAELAETPAADARQQVAVERFAGGALPPLVACRLEDGTFGRRAARGLRVFWRAALDDAWGTLRRALDDDIARRSQELSRAGLTGVVNGLHPALHTDGRHLDLDLPWDERGTLTDTDLVLSPLLFGAGSLGVQFHRPHQAVVRYRAFGAGRGRRPGRVRGLDRLLGATRAALLLDLDVPRSTTTLSARLHLSPPAVSHHLQVLAESGLVVRHRDGRRVLYRRSERGDLLIA